MEIAQIDCKGIIANLEKAGKNSSIKLHKLIGYVMSVYSADTELKRLFSEYIDSIQEENNIFMKYLDVAEFNNEQLKNSVIAHIGNKNKGDNK